MAKSDQNLVCRDIDHDANRYSICTVDAGKADLRLFLNGDNGRLLGQFRAIDAMLEAENGKLAFAMNGGMYHSNRAPVGHYVENSNEVMRVVPNAGPGNFGLLPNGVFCIREDRADVFETLAFIARAPDCDFASQSGPMLVIDGALHPRFLPDSTSRYIRNGVGTSIDGTRAVFAISRNRVTFHEFGRLFRDELKLPNALYFDGNISRLYAPELGRHDAGFPMGPVVGVVVERTN
ncbi:MAG: phosphodiester glycosidase family protein [Rhodobacteraceae bacterium]|nr:phosphodiester glycosidase family protein [Paracoccaceae bacterium]